MYVADTGLNPTDPRRPVRGVSIHDWPEKLDDDAVRAMFLEMVVNFADFPFEAEYKLPGKTRFKRRKLRSLKKFETWLSEFSDFEMIGIYLPIGKVLANPLFSMSLDLSQGSFLLHAQKNLRVWSIADVVSHLKLACRHVTPVYGFSRISQAARSHFDHVGITNQDSDKQEFFNFAAFQDALGPYGNHAHILGKLHDVYELNVLSPKHLERDELGPRLDAWIKKHGHGELIAVGPHTQAWIVPESTRPLVRSELLKAGLLIATI